MIRTVAAITIGLTSMASHIYGRRTSKRRAEKIKHCVEQAMKAEDE
ncbi:hypothetical protein KSZ_65010 [Dictyobacter formicarum]|uniref:Uncharacterized protein n=1 Tax=Dictyobacter formicarum TaxID=2778368 RepID=A0ABQ3VQS1_9CHLR|nr:hypothetical protein KSZ_65010 [Dictyobacter formicarum]